MAAFAKRFQDGRFVDPIKNQRNPARVGNLEFILVEPIPRLHHGIDIGGGHLNEDHVHDFPPFRSLMMNLH
jgi:hypothetical protein